MTVSQILLTLFLWQYPKGNTHWPEKRLILGHRGARALAPENTLPSFKLAMDLGADGVEFDVFLTKDKVPIVIHDETLERTTSGVGNVWDMNLADLQKLNAAKEWPQDGIFIPTLSQTLEAMPDGSVVNIELKGEGLYTKEEFVDLILNTIESSRERLFIVISSFDTKLLRIVRKKDAAISVGFLLDEEDWRYLPSLSQINAVRPDALHIRPKLCNAKLIEQAHSKGLRVMVWTVNDPIQARALFEAGVDGIFSDLPQGMHSRSRP